MSPSRDATAASEPARPLPVLPAQDDEPLFELTAEAIEYLAEAEVSDHGL